MVPKHFFCILILGCISLKATAFEVTEVGQKSVYIRKLIENHHYNKIVFDDAFAEEVFNRFLESVDPLGLYLKRSDYLTLSVKWKRVAKLGVDRGTSELFDETAVKLKNGLSAIKLHLEHNDDIDFDWDKQEVLSFAEEDYPDYVDDITALEERWRLWLKYQVLEALFSEEFHPDPYHTTIDSVLLYEEEAKEAVLKAELFEINQFLEHPSGYKNYLSAFYLDAIATSIDPHTTYFSANAQQDFVEELSRDNYAFGIQLDENEKGNVVIHGLMPGSPAWISNELNKGDIVLALQLGDEYMDLTQKGIDDVNLLFANSSAKTLIMKVQKANGQTREVHLEKGVVYVDGDVIKSVVLEGEQRIGYITLPDFYTDWEDVNGTGCANDLAKTIVKLKQEEIGGLILDLRNNGGGSLKEAIDLAGIFINYGPIAIFQEQSREPVSLKDFNKGSIYDGPLVILVNGLSASASEIFSAAMQDYNRAIIVGSRTYGKSTGQVVLPLDPSGADESLGYLKVTTSKYYRINKSTHQKEGVIPDVQLPDVYDIYDYRESSYDNAMGKDSVNKKVYFTPFDDFPVALLNQRSQKRLTENGIVPAVNTLVDSLSQVEKTLEKYSLNIREYKLENKALGAAVDRLFGLIEKEASTFEIKNNKFDQNIIDMNDYRSKLNTIYKERLKNDIYIDEAYQVLADYINFKKN